MEDFNANKVEEKFKSSVWKKILKEFSYFKRLFIIGVILGGIIGSSRIVEPKITKYVIDTFVIKHDLGRFNRVILFTCFFLLIFSLIKFLFMTLIGSLDIKMSHRLRTKCFIKLQELSISFYDKNAVGHIMARMSSDINKLSKITAWGATELFWGACMMISVFVAMLTDSLKLSSIVFITLPVIIVFSGYLKRKILKAQRQVRKINSQLTASYNEDIQGAKTTKTLVTEQLNSKEFLEKSEKMESASVIAIALSSLLMPAVQLIGAVGTAFLVVYGGVLVLEGAVSMGLLVAFFSYITKFNAPLAQASDLFAEFISAQAAAERVFSLLEQEPEIIDSPDVIKKYGTSIFPSGEALPEIEGNVKFENVSFWYNEKEPVLIDFNLEVKKGETVALVGATGAGKSTIVNLFCRFYEPKKGRILVDGIDYTTMSQNWIHKNLGYVLQHPHLFSGTIAENIRYGKMDASNTMIIEAAKMVDAHEFIEKTKNGYDTEVGEGGAFLSTGQKQLISFARTLVRSPRLFVLDEATSSIDTETEQKIQKAISTVLSGRTSFVVAHRLSTIRHADKIIVLDKGKMIESGTHDELIKQKGAYYALYTNQFINEKYAALNIKKNN